MSTPSLRALSRRAGAAPYRNLASYPTFSYGRTAAYRRIASYPQRSSDVSLRPARSPSSAIALPSALRLPFSHPTVSINPTQTRHVSFKELREQRQREKAGEAQQGQKQEQPQARPSAQSQPPPEDPLVKDESPAASAAEEAFAKARSESEREWAKFEEAARKEQEQEEKAQEESGEAGEEGAKQEKGNKQAPDEPPHGTKTPWQVFTETLSSEFKASKEWNESTQQLSGSIHDFTQNPNVQKARSAYSRAAEAASTTTGKVVMGSASAIGKSAAWTWETPVVRGLRHGASAIGSGVEKATRPLRETEAYKNVKDVVDDGSASQRYGGWTEKEERKRQRELREAKAGRTQPQVHEEDPNAGVNVTLHKDSAWNQSWKSFRDNSPVMQRIFGLGATYRESENPLISTARSVSDRIAGFFAENETAMVIKKFREMDPSFQLEPFLTEMRTYILPEVLEAYVKGDVETLQLWLSAAQFQVYSALMQQYTTQGLKSDGKILDIRNVDILSARMLDPGEVPVFVLMARTQEVHVYRNAKSGELAAGMEDKVQQVTYAIGVTRLPEEVANPETRGWRLIELQKSGRDYI